MKIIDRYVLREHAGPLLFALSALTSLLLLNYIAKQFTKLVGKGLPWRVIGEFFLLSLPFVVAMTLPMAVLVATLYAFSRMASESEITALKASGVSMPRLLTPVLIAATGIALGMIWFNDQVLPRANHALATLQADIARVKPTFALKEQVINPVREGQLYLRAGQIAENSNVMREVVIYNLENPNRRQTIFADSGTVAFSPSMRDLVLTLYDGSVQELPGGARTGELQRVWFERQFVRVRDVGSQLERSDERGYRGDREMSVCEMRRQVLQAQSERQAAQAELELTLLQATRALATGEPQLVEPDTASLERRAIAEPFGLGQLYCRYVVDGFGPRPLGAQAPAAGAPGGAAPPAPQFIAPPGSTEPPPGRSLGDVRIGDSAADSAMQRAALQYAPSTGYLSPIGSVEAMTVRQSQSLQRMRTYQVEIEKKFALAVACVVFVLFGAPLALRFPRGGVGLVLGISISVFAIYYVGLIGGEALADRGIMSPFFAMWTANLVFTLIGLVLLARMGREASTARGGDLREAIDTLRGRWRARRARRRGAAVRSGA